MSGNVIPTLGKLRQKIGLLKSSVNTIKFGDIFYQQSDTQTIEIENKKSLELTMTVDDCPDHIKLEIKPATLAPGKKGEILVTFDSKIKNTYGSSRDVPQISMKLGERVYKGSINIQANVVEDFSQLSAKKIEKAPVIHFPKESIDIGEIKEKQNKSIDFEFENLGKSKLLIRNIEMNNTSFILAEYDKVIKPGRKGKLTLTTNPAFTSSRMDTRVTVISNDPKSSITTLKLYGTKKISKPALKKSKNLHTKFKNIKVHEVNKLIEEYKKSEKLVILDVRTPREYENGCLPEALNFDIQDKNFNKTIQLLDKARIYLVYCESGIRSKKAIMIMNKLGFNNLYHMFEGMDGWERNRLEVSNPDK